MRLAKTLAGTVLILLIALVAASPALAGTFTFTVVDQNGTSWGSNTWVYVLGAGQPFIQVGNPVTVPDGTYTMRVRYGNALTKDYPDIVVDSSTSSLEFVWEGRDVQLRIVNQYGGLIHPVAPANALTGMTTSLHGYSTQVTNGGTVHIPINDDVYDPTIGGGPTATNAGYNFVGWFSGSHLYRMEPGVVGPTTTVLEMVWPTADVTFHLVDQNGADITANNAAFSLVYWQGTSPFLFEDLPCNDTSLDPAIASWSIWANHYEWRGYVLSNHLYRGWGRSYDPNGAVLKVTPDTTDFTCEWHVQDVALVLTDQDGNPFPSINGFRSDNYELSIASWPYIYTYNGSVASLPVNDPALYPALRGVDTGYSNGSAADGYNIRAVIDSTRNYYDGFVVNTTTTQFEVPWNVVTGPLRVVDAGGSEVPGSVFQIQNPTGGGDVVRPSGDPVTLAVTDNDFYPYLAGSFANGFPIAVTPGDGSGSATYQFEVLPSGELTPQWFTVGGQTYGLRFVFNEAPAAIAGDNVTILSSEQANTTVDGVGTDPDGDPMTYRWLDGGGAEIQASQAVGALGEAPLYLAALPALAIGDHTFVLEVSDGQEAVSDSMILTVDNSPPDVATGGNITAEVGTDVELTAEAADYDGDALSWTWSEGATVVASGSLATIAGGDSVDVPAVIVTGLSLGTHGLTLTVDDGVNAPVSSNLSVTVIDTQAPTLAPVADTAMLWPPNHQMVTVSITLNASDNSGGPVSITAEVASTENPDKDGDGNTIPDFTEPAIDEAAGTLTLQLRAERSGKGTGRTYTITITAIDDSGNDTESTIQIVCPHDRRRK